VLASGGASSTMPQKVNPVGPSVLVALARQSVALSGAVQGAGLHRQARDGAAWFTEWLTLPQLCIGTGRALALAGETAAGLRPDQAQMRAGLEADGGLIHAEALSFALAQQMPRPEAQAMVKTLCARVRAGGGTLPDEAARAFPDLDIAALLNGPETLGTAPDEALAFARACRKT
jgi:3-carboxy-cis,cis-muconate cycloisomerase